MSSFLSSMPMSTGSGIARLSPVMVWARMLPFFFFLNDTATTEISPLSLHDALPISLPNSYAICHSESNSYIHANAYTNGHSNCHRYSDGHLYPNINSYCYRDSDSNCDLHADSDRDRKSTRLNSSHSQISYAVFCLNT